MLHFQSISQPQHIKSITFPKPNVSFFLFPWKLLTAPSESGSSPHQDWDARSGTRTPDLPPPPQPLCPKFPSHPPLEADVRWGLGQVVDAAMKEDLNPATRPEGRREEVDEWQRWRRRRYVGGHKTSKTTTITARKQTTRRKKTSERKERGAKEAQRHPRSSN